LFRPKFLQGFEVKTGKIKVLAIGVFASLFLALVAAWIWLSSSPPAIALPTPNGFDVLVDASSSVQRSILTEDETKLKEFLALNSGPMKLVDEAMEMECVVPVDFSAGIVNQLQMPREAFRLLDARAKVLQQNGESRAAAIEWAKMYAYATNCAEGGLLVHWLSGVAFENMALNGLQGVIEELSPEEKQEVLEIIEAAARQPVDFAAIQEREYAVVRGEYGALVGTFLIRTAGATTKPAFDAANESEERISALLEDVIQALKQ